MENIKKVKICLAGNPNCGKSSLFNNITGLRQHVGNYPGVTVEKKEAFITKNGYELQIIDLPGIYGLSASSEDEIVARNVLIEEKPELVIDVVDSSNLERNLYLYAQLSELKIPVVIAMNMTDILENKGQKIDYKKLEEKYNVVAVPIVASKNKGTEELLNTVTDVLSKKKIIKSVSIDYGKEINKEKDTICQLISEDLNLVLKNNYKFVIMTNKKKLPVENKLKKYSFNVEVFANEDMQNYSSKGELMQHYMQKNGIKECYFIEDSIENIKSCEKYNNIKGLLANWGYVHPNTAGYSPEQILEIIEKEI